MYILQYIRASTRCTKIRFMYPRKWNCAVLVPIPTFMYLWAIYIFPESVCLFSCSKIGRPILGINKSLTDTWMWNWETEIVILSWQYCNETAQFHFWEHINRNQTFILNSHSPSFAVYPKMAKKRHIGWEGDIKQTNHCRRFLLTYRF